MHHKNKTLMPLLLACASASAPAAFAAEPGGNKVMEEIVVTSRYKEESSQDVPISISAFSAGELERQSVQTTFDLQFQTPSLRAGYTSSGGTGVSFSLRGQSASDSLLTTDSSVGIYADGISIPRVFGLNTGMFDLERIEVLKGPQGTLFGRNTTGGAIHMISRKANHDGLHGYIEMEAGDFSQLNYGGAVNIPLSDTAALRLAAKRTTSDGWDDSAADGKPIADDDETLVRANLMLDPNDNLNISLTLEYMDVNENHDPRRNYSLAGGAFFNATLEGYTPGFLVATSLAGGGDYYDFDPGDRNHKPERDFSRNASTLAITYDFSESLTFKSITGWHDFEALRTSDLDGGPSSTHLTLLDMEADFFSQEFQLLGTAADDKMDWVVGAYYSKEDGNDNSRTWALSNLGTVPQFLFLGEVENKSWAVFGQMNYQFNEQWRLTAGYRYTEEDKSLESGNAFDLGPFELCRVTTIVPGGCLVVEDDSFDGNSWTLSLDYFINPDVMLYLRTAEGFKGGGQNLRGIDPTSFTAVDPEYAQDIELGMKGDFADGRVRLNAAFYQTNYEDIQRSSIVPAPGGGSTTVIKNAAEASIDGLELTAIWAPTDSLSFVLNLDTFDAEYDKWIDIDAATLLPYDRSSQPFPGSDLSYSLSVRWDQQVSLGDLNLTLDYVYSDEALLTPERPKATRIYREEYGMVNARVSLAMDNGWEVAVLGKNLNDEEYLTSIVDLGVSLGNTVAMVNQPRYWGVQIKKSFN